MNSIKFIQLLYPFTSTFEYFLIATVVAVELPRGENSMIRQERCPVQPVSSASEFVGASEGQACSLKKESND